MKIKCDYCGNFLDDSDEKCPYCGAANNGIKRTGVEVPRTIEELKQWYIDKHLPDENTTRFFIDRDYAGPKAFGIYKQSDGDFVVYKNKADGTRVTRYVGKDEAYAVQEIYLKLKEEMQNQKNKSSYVPPQGVRSSYYTPNYDTNKKTDRKSIILIIFIIIIFMIFMSFISRNSGRYYYGNGYHSSYYDNDSSYSNSSWSNNDDSYSSSWYDNDDSYSDSWSSSSWDNDWDSSSSWDSDWSDWDSDW